MKKIFYLLYIFLHTTNLSLSAPEITITQINTFDSEKTLDACISILQSKNNHKFLFPFFTTSQLELFLTTTATSPHKELWVADHKKSIVGLAILNHDKDTSNLDTLAVKEDAQHKGIGYALITNIIKKIAPKKTLTLLVDATNNRARNLYQKVGFQCNKKYGPYEEYFLRKTSNNE